jgi:hypothetical protein
MGRYKLRGSFIATGLVAAIVGSLAYRANFQSKIVKRIVGQGGYARYSWQYDATGAFNPDAEPAVPLWLLSIINQNCFMSVTRLHFPMPSSAEALQMARQLGTIETLSLDIDSNW